MMGKDSGKDNRTQLVSERRLVRRLRFLGSAQRSQGMAQTQACCHVLLPSGCTKGTAPLHRTAERFHFRLGLWLVDALDPIVGYRHGPSREELAWLVVAMNPSPQAGP